MDPTIKQARKVVSSLLKSLGTGGMCSIGSGGWGSCDYCSGWPEHKSTCPITVGKKYLKDTTPPKGKKKPK